MLFRKRFIAFLKSDLSEKSLTILLIAAAIAIVLIALFAPWWIKIVTAAYILLP